MSNEELDLDKCFAEAEAFDKKNQEAFIASFAFFAMFRFRTDEDRQAFCEAVQELPEYEKTLDYEMEREDPDPIRDGWVGSDGRP